MNKFSLKLIQMKIGKKILEKNRDVKFATKASEKAVFKNIYTLMARVIHLHDDTADLKFISPR